MLMLEEHVSVGEGFGRREASEIVNESISRYLSLKNLLLHVLSP
jgi:hypothetical protein